MSDIEIIEVQHGSPDWFTARLGIPTASEAASITAGGDGKVRSEYVRRLAGEQVSRLPAERFKSRAMERGNGMEPELRSLYEMVTGRKPLPVSADPDLRFQPDQPGYGFVKRKMKIGLAGASPDSRVIDKDQEGGLEIKSMAPALLIEVMQRGMPPPAFLPQCQFTMMIRGWPWVDLLVGYSGMPPFIRRVRRDPSKIAQMEVGIETFNEELQAMVAWVRAYGKDSR